MWRQERKTGGNPDRRNPACVILYLKADDALPFGNWQGMVPFSYLLECPDMPKDVRYQLSNRVEQISVTMTGSDSVEVKAVLDFDVF